MLPQLRVYVGGPHGIHMRPTTRKYQALADRSFYEDDEPLKPQLSIPSPTGNRSKAALTDDFPRFLATNGPMPTAPMPTRASPAPQAQQQVPNGKPTSPYTERPNPTSPNAQIAAQTVSSKDPKAAAQAASDMRNVVRRKLTGYVGFANLPNQWHRKSVRKGFNFNVMIVGMYKHHGCVLEVV